MLSFKTGIWYKESGIKNWFYNSSGFSLCFKPFWLCWLMRACAPVVCWMRSACSPGIQVMWRGRQMFLMVLPCFHQVLTGIPSNSLSFLPFAHFPRHHDFFCRKELNEILLGPAWLLRTSPCRGEPPTLPLSGRVAGRVAGRVCASQGLGPEQQDLGAALPCPSVPSCHTSLPGPHLPVLKFKKPT